ncbi:hypothetical protein BH10PSE12_BH10PSE12_38460 [soil metagenome]
MPRYHFHVKDGQDYQDLQGTLLPDLAAARREALRFTGALLGEEVNQFWEGTTWAMIVTDDKGNVLFNLAFQATDDPLAPGYPLPPTPAPLTDDHIAL